MKSHKQNFLSSKVLILTFLLCGWVGSASSSSPIDGQLGIDSSGNAIAIWLEVEGGTNVIEAANFTGSSSTWSTPVQLSTSSHDVLMTKISVSSSGNGAVIWVDVDPTGLITVYGAYYTFSTSSWSTAQVLSNIDGSELPLDDQSVAISDDVDGTIVAIWNAILNGEYVIRSSNTTIGGAWSSAITISD